MKTPTYDRFMKNFIKKSIIEIDCDDNSPYYYWIMSATKKKHITYTKENIEPYGISTSIRKKYDIKLTELGSVYMSFVLL